MTVGKILAMLMLLQACDGTTSKPGPVVDSSPPPPAPLDVDKPSSVPFAFASILAVDGVPATESSVRVGRHVSCLGETKSPAGSAISYKTIWTARSKRFGFADWVSKDVSLSLSDGIVPSLVAHLEISCKMIAISDMADETESAPSDFTKIINTDPSPFETTVGGLRLSTTSRDSGLGDNNGGSFSFADDRLSCAGSTSDRDDDILSYSVSWDYKSSESLGWEAADARLLHTVLKDKVGAELRCTTTAYDVAGGIQISHSASSRIGNRAPRPFTSVFKKNQFGFFTEPQAGSLLSVGDLLSCSASALDLDQTASPALTFEWQVSDSPNMISPILMSSSQIAELQSVGAHRYVGCVAVATDPQGAITRSNFISFLTKNTPPSPFTTTIGGDLHHGQTVTCNASPKDVDGDELISQFVWTSSASIDGPPDTMAVTSNAITITTGMVKKYISCTQIVDDQHGGSQRSSPSPPALILNTAPTVSKAVISIDSTADQIVTVESTLHCEAATEDKDENPVSLFYSWEKASVNGGGFTPIVQKDIDPSSESTAKVTTQNIALSYALAHKYLRCQVSASDPFSFIVQGEASDSLLVTNTKPASFSVIDISSPILVGETHNCDGATTDLDHDVLTYSRVWSVQKINNQNDPVGDFVDVRSLLGASSPNPLVADFVIPPSLAHRSIKCKIAADDGHSLEVVRTPDSKTTLIANTPPRPFTAGAPERAKTGDVLACDQITTDIDGDQLTMTSRWRITRPDHTILVGGETLNSDHLTVPKREVGSLITCLRSVTDLFGGLTTFNYPVTTVINSNPESFQARLSSDAEVLKVGNTLTCSGGTFDVDDDLSESRLTYKSRFTERQADGSDITLAGTEATTFASPINGNHQKTHVVTSLDAHKNIACEITAKDFNDGETISSLSSLIEVTNTAPGDMVSVISSPDASVVIGSIVSCAPVSPPSDVDDDTISMTYEWYKSATQIPNSAATYTLIGSLSTAEITLPTVFSHGEIMCVAVANDHHGGITKGPISERLSIANSAPNQLSSKVVRVSEVEPLLSGLQINQFGYASQLSCDEAGPRFDKDLDEIAIVSYQWGTLQNNIFQSVDSLGFDKTITVGDGNRRVLAHKEVACLIVVKDIAPSFVTWSESKSTVGSFGQKATYINASPLPFAETISLTGSPSYSDVLSNKIIDMKDKTVVGSTVSCVSGPLTDPDNGELTEDLPDTMTSNHKLQIKHTFFGLAGWTTKGAGNSHTLDQSAAHTDIRCEGSASDGFGGLTLSDDMQELSVVNTPPIVSKAPTNESPLNVYEDSTLEVTTSNLTASDTDGDNLIWSQPGTPSGPLWAFKLRILRSVNLGSIYTISTKPNSSLGSDGYDYASLSSPFTPESASINISVTDGQISSDGAIGVKVQNVDRPSVVTGYSTSRVYPDSVDPEGRRIEYLTGTIPVLSEYSASLINSTTGADSGCAATPDESQELYSDQGFFMQGNGELNPTMSATMNAPTVTLYKKAASTIDIKILYDDPDGDKLMLDEASTVSYDTLGNKTAADATLYKLTVTSDPTVMRLTIKSCDFVAHGADMTNRNSQGVAISYFEKSNGTNVSGHFRRRWSAPINISLAYKPEGGTVAGTIIAKARVLDADRKPAVKWFGASSASPTSWQAVAVGGSFQVAEPYSPLLSWTLSADPDMDEVEAYESSPEVLSLRDLDAFYDWPSYSNDGNLCDIYLGQSVNNFDYRFCGFETTSGMAPGTSTPKLKTAWDHYQYYLNQASVAINNNELDHLVRDYYQVNNYVNDPNLKKSGRSSVRAFNLSKSICLDENPLTDQNDRFVFASDDEYQTWKNPATMASLSNLTLINLLVSQYLTSMRSWINPYERGRILQYVPSNLVASRSHDASYKNPYGTILASPGNAFGDGRCAGVFGSVEGVSHTGTAALTDTILNTQLGLNLRQDMSFRTNLAGPNTSEVIGGDGVTGIIKDTVQSQTFVISWTAVHDVSFAFYGAQTSGFGYNLNDSNWNSTSGLSCYNEHLMGFFNGHWSIGYQAVPKTAGWGSYVFSNGTRRIYEHWYHYFSCRPNYTTYYW